MGVLHISLGKGDSLGDGRDTNTHKALIPDFFQRHGPQLHLRQNLLRIGLGKVQQFFGGLDFKQLRFPHAGGINVHVTDTLFIQQVPVVVHKPGGASRFRHLVAVPEYKINVPIQFFPVLA